MKRIALIITALALAATFFILGSVLIYRTQAASPESSGAKDAQTASTEEISLPIVMYHSVLKTRRGKYTIHPDELERDIKKYLKLGYTPVLLREVSAWVEGRGDLPEKPMVITFDDGHYNNLYYALPILRKHNVKAVVNIVTSFSRHSTETPGEAHNPNYSSLTWDDIRELHDIGLIEIGNHTHAMHKFKPRYGIAQVSNETVDQYKQAIRDDLEKANTYLTESAGVPRPETFAYPFGKYTKAGREVLQSLGFKAILTCNEGITKIRRGDPESLLELKRYNRSGTANHNAFIKKVFGM